MATGIVVSMLITTVLEDLVREETDLEVSSIKKIRNTFRNGSPRQAFSRLESNMVKGAALERLTQRNQGLRWLGFDG